MITGGAMKLSLRTKFMIGIIAIIIFSIQYFYFDMYLSAETYVKRALNNLEKIPAEHLDKVEYMLAEKKRMEKLVSPSDYTAIHNTNISLLYKNHNLFRQDLIGEDETVRVYLYGEERNHLNIPLRYTGVMFILLKKKPLFKWEIIEVYLHPYVYSGAGFGYAYPVDLYNNLEEMLKSLEVD